MTTTHIKVTGMHCAGCKALIEDICRDIAGVIACSIDAATGKGDIEHGDAFDFAAFATEVASLGSYTVEKI